MPCSFLTQTLQNSLRRIILAISLVNSRIIYFILTLLFLQCKYIFDGRFCFIYFLLLFLIQDDPRPLPPPLSFHPFFISPLSPLLSVSHKSTFSDIFTKTLLVASDRKPNADQLNQNLRQHIQNPIVLSYLCFSLCWHSSYSGSLFIMARK